MGTERGLQRLINFSDAVVAIAITLLVLPLVDAASSIGSTGLGHFFDQSRPRLLAFTLSFAVIGSFWWGQHQMFERVRSYNTGLVLATFVWLFGIVFLPFPTELLGASRQASVAVHGIYVGTMVVAAIATLAQQWTIVRWPELQDEEGRGSAEHRFGIGVGRDHGGGSGGGPHLASGGALVVAPAGALATDRTPPGEPKTHLGRVAARPETRPSKGRVEGDWGRTGKTWTYGSGQPPEPGGDDLGHLGIPIP